MIYVSGDNQINFYEETVASRKVADFVKENKESGLTKEQLTEVHELCTKALGKPVVKDSSFNQKDLS